MITKTTSNLDKPFKFQNNIDNLLLRKIDYQCEVIKTSEKKQIISRDANYLQIKTPNEFNYIINDCVKRETYEEPIQLKYKRLLLEKQEGGEEADEENIDSMLATIKRQISSYKDIIGRSNKFTNILYSTILLYLERLDQTTKADIETFISKEINQDLFKKCNSLLQDLSSMDNLKMEEKQKVE